MSASPLFDFFTSTSVLLAVATAIAGALSAWHGWRSGGISTEAAVAKEVSDLVSSGTSEAPQNKAPFEVLALSKYYNHALLRANVSFWFSIIFGAVGFGVIVLSFAMHNPDDVLGTLIKAGSGAVIDAVAGIFFVQSINAQKSMTQFFENLRLDRLNAEARSLILEIEDVERRDQLRAQLVLKYAGIDRLLVGKSGTETH